MIRDARSDDIKEMIALTQKVYTPFLEKHGLPINQDDIKTTATNCVKNNQCLIVERDNKVVGLAAWQLLPHAANYKCVIFQEILWCLDSPNVMDASILLKAIERKAKELKADIIILGNLSIENEPQLRRIYSKLGYSYLETQYSKQIGG